MKSVNQTIRKITATDNAALAQMIRIVFEEHDAPQQGTVYSDPATDKLYELFQTPGSILWVAEMHDTAVGCCGIYPTKGLPENYAELVKFYLAKDARGYGIGKELLLKCIHSARELGYKQLYLESLPHFSKALGMYEKQGFVRLEAPLGKSEHPGCTIWMLKDLGY